jgi:transcriptional regulator with XRE-family HTH domain
MRLAGLDLALHGCDTMSAAQTIREWLQQTLQRDGLTVEKWAQLSGVAKSTIFRALKPDYEFVTSSRTLNRLAEAVGAEPPSLLSQVKLAPRFLPVRYVVQAGLWFENDAEIPPEQSPLAVLPDPRIERFPQWLEKVVGDSVDLKIAPGHYAHVVDAVELGYAPRHGDWVVVERQRDQGAVRERTIKQVDTQSGVVRLCPRSRNPKWSEPVDLAAGGKAGDIEVRIVGLVVGAYNSDF